MGPSVTPTVKVRKNSSPFEFCWNAVGSIGYGLPGHRTSGHGRVILLVGCTVISHLGWWCHHHGGVGWRGVNRRMRCVQHRTKHRRSNDRADPVVAVTAVVRICATHNRSTTPSMRHHTWRMGSVTPAAMPFTCLSGCERHDSGATNCGDQKFFHGGLFGDAHHMPGPSFNASGLAQDDTVAAHRPEDGQGDRKETLCKTCLRENQAQSCQKGSACKVQSTNQASTGFSLSRAGCKTSRWPAESTQSLPPCQVNPTRVRAKAPATQGCPRHNQRRARLR